MGMNAQLEAILGQNQMATQSADNNRLAMLQLLAGIQANARDAEMRKLDARIRVGELRRRNVMDQQKQSMLTEVLANMEPKPGDRTKIQQLMNTDKDPQEQRVS